MLQQRVKTIAYQLKLIAFITVAAIKIVFVNARVITQPVPMHVLAIRDVIMVVRAHMKVNTVRLVRPVLRKSTAFARL